MAVRTLEEIMTATKEILGDRNDDVALSYIEDLQDTIKGDGEDWKSKYDGLDAMWRERYRNRFFSASSDSDKDITEDTGEEEKKGMTINALFKED